MLLLLLLLLLLSRLQIPSALLTVPLSGDTVQHVMAKCDILQSGQCPEGEVCGWKPGANGREGVCAIPPVGGVILPMPKNAGAGVVLPVAYYPLSGSLSSWPPLDQKYSHWLGFFEDDPVLGVVLKCDKWPILLDEVKYGQSGAFAINIWAKADVFSTNNEHGDQFIYSHSSASGATTETLNARRENQVHIFIPGEATPGQAFFRSLVKGSGKTAYLDSNISEMGSNPTPLDGKWHMITLTSKLDGSKGSMLYIDGELIAESVMGTAPSDSLSINGRIFLCGRAGFGRDARFWGWLSKLSVYDDVLPPPQVKALYEITLGIAAPDIEAPAVEPTDLDLEEDEFPFDLFAWENPTGGLLLAGGQEKSATLPESFFSESRVDKPEVIDLMNIAKSATLCAFDSNPQDSIRLATDICAPVPKQVLLFIEHSKTGDEEDSLANGVSTKTHGEYVPLPISHAKWPIPVAYFPLTEGRVKSWPVEFTQGYLSNVDVVDDSSFGQVFHCNSSKQSLIVLDNVPYGEQGPFAVNFWFRASNLQGLSNQYLFSHFGVDAAAPANNMSPNQVSIYIAEEEHAHPGIVRTYIKDDNDNDRTPEKQALIDSSGEVLSFAGSRFRNGSIVNIADKDWHMATVTTIPDGKRGYSLYLDNVLVAEVVEGRKYTGVDGQRLFLQGGDPMRAGGRIHLCGRYDGKLNTFFDGEIVHLALFDSALTEQEVTSMYSSALEEMPLLAASSKPQLPDKSNAPADPRPLNSSWTGHISDKEGELLGSCRQTNSRGASCDENLICVPTLKRGSSGVIKWVSNGVCAKSPGHGVYMLGAEDDVEIPIAYFPLTGSITDSWPFPHFKASSDTNAQFVDDTVFGSVLDCRSANKNQVVLDNVDYGFNGTFTINLWTRKTKDHSGSEQGFHYLFSHSNPGQNLLLRFPSQVQIYQLGKTHQLAGLVRVYVLDINDAGKPISYLDSDGKFAKNKSREDRKNSSSIDDDQWHMITLTTHTESKGYSLYIDGQLQATVRKSLEKEDQDRNGGDPTGITGPIYICSRTDENKGRYYNGKVAHLAIWHKVLTPQKIYKLYATSFVVAASKQVAHPARFTVEGEQCLFPAILRGELLIDCGGLLESLKCPTKSGNWMECDEYTAKPFHNPFNATVRHTVDGELCKFPTKQRGELFSDCVVKGGTKPMCQVQGKSKEWKSCAEKVLRYSRKGAVCELPSTIKGETVSDCVKFDGVEKCMVNGELRQCSPKGDTGP